MAKLFSFPQCKDGPAEGKAQKSARTPKGIRKLLSRTRSLFRSHNTDTTTDVPTPESSASFKPLDIPSLHHESTGLQGEIDGELLMLNESPTPSPPKLSNSLSSDHPARNIIVIPSDSTRPQNDATTSPRSVTESATYPGALLSVHSNKKSQKSIQGDGHKQVQGTNEDVDAESSSYCSVVHHMPDSDRRTERPSFLQAVRSTWNNTHARLPSSPETAKRDAATWSDSHTYETPPVSWRDHVVDPDLRRILTENRAHMVQDVHRDVAATYGFQNAPLPEASEVSRNSTPEPLQGGVPLPRNVQCSWDLANAKVFGRDTDNELESFDLSGLFSEPGTPQTAQQDLLAQNPSEVEDTHQSHAQLSVYIKAALSEQEAELRSGFERELAAEKEAFEARFEESHASTAQFHETLMTNLREELEDELKDLKNDLSDLRRRAADKAKSLRLLRLDKDTLEARCSTIEGQLGAAFRQRAEVLQAYHELEATLQEKVDEIHGLREELNRTRGDYETWLRVSQDGNAQLEREHTALTHKHNGLLRGFNQLNAHRQNIEAQLHARNDELEATRTALKESQQASKELRARHDYVVAEKARDFTWHVENNAIPSAPRPMNLEAQISEATVELRQRLEEQIETSADLNRQLESAQASNKAKFKKLKRVIANQSQEKVILEMALGMAQSQREYWAEEYGQIAEAVASRLSFTSYARGVAEKQMYLQQTRLDLERQLLEAKLRGDRAVLETAVVKKHEVIKLGKRDAEIVQLNRKLETMKFKLEYERSMALHYKSVLDDEVPGLRQRNSQVERLLRDQVTNNAHADHQAVFADLHRRLSTAENVNKYWERQVNLQLQEHEDLKLQFSFSNYVTMNDLTSARSWRDERDALEIEVVALKERFADELLIEPLAIPEDKKTRSQIDEESRRLESIDATLLQQYGHTVGALPRTLVDRYADPWDHVRVDVHEDFEQLKGRWIVWRDALEKSFQTDSREGTDAPGRDGVDSPHETSKHARRQEKQIATGPHIGNDGQREFCAAQPQNEAHLVGVAGPSVEPPIVDWLAERDVFPAGGRGVVVNL